MYFFVIKSSSDVSGMSKNPGFTTYLSLEIVGWKANDTQEWSKQNNISTSLPAM